MSELTPKEINILAVLCAVGLLAFFFVIFYAASNSDKVTPADPEIQEPSYFWEY